VLALVLRRTSALAFWVDLVVEVVLDTTRAADPPTHPVGPQPTGQAPLDTIMQQPVALHLTLTYNGQQLKEDLRLPEPGSDLVFKFGRNHKFGGAFAYQQVGVVSGSHFVVHVHGNRAASITDTSSNGTFLNGAQLKKGRTVKLADGDRITLVGPNTRVGLIDVKFAKEVCALSEEELALVRRYVFLLSAGDGAPFKLERQQIDKVGFRSWVLSCVVICVWCSVAQLVLPCWCDAVGIRAE
jgi:hypothetical protein